MYNKDVSINNKEVLYLSKELFVRAEEVAGALGISKPYAYKLVREMNEELKQKGFLTIPGRVSRRYFEEKFYGLRENQ
ncbi:DNA-binding protein [Acutalibacter muris]